MYNIKYSSRSIKMNSNSIDKCNDLIFNLNKFNLAYKIKCNWSAKNTIYMMYYIIDEMHTPTKANNVGRSSNPTISSIKFTRLK